MGDPGQVARSEKSLYDAASGWDGCTMVPFPRSKRKLRIKIPPVQFATPVASTGSS